MTLSFFPLQLSTTQDVEVYNRCPYLWSKFRIEWWRRYTYNNHIEFGKEFASALETTRKAYYKECLTAQDSINLGLQQILETFGETFQPSSFNEDIKTPAKMQEVFVKYFEEFPLDSDLTPFLLPNGELSVEQRYDIELPYLHPELNVPLILSAKPDILGIDSNGNVCLVDEKTASQSGMADMVKSTDKYRTRNQFVQYTTLINNNNLLGEGKRITQAKVRRVVITKIKLIDSSKANKGLIPKTSKVVEEYSFDIDRWYQDTWWNTTLDIVGEMLESYKKYKENDTMAFRRRYGNCESFFNPCELTQHCTSGAAQAMERLGYAQLWHDKDANITLPLVDKRKELNLGCNNDNTTIHSV